MNHEAETLVALLEAGAAEAPALSTPGGVPTSYRGLRQLVASTIEALAKRGVGAGDRVAIVLDNGPEMAAAFLGIAAGAAAAPLNPAYRAEELEFYLTDLRARLLVVGQGKDTPAVAVAGRLGIPVARLHPQPERGAGSFTLEGGDGAAPRPLAAATPDDVALVLHTSGTTSRPKIVPLTQRNICASAHNVRQSLALSASDRGLAIMPLFHIHGRVGKRKGVGRAAKRRGGRRPAPPPPSPPPHSRAAPPRPPAPAAERPARCPRAPIRDGGRRPGRSSGRSARAARPPRR
jgi:oxalate---CoA ligase